MHQHNSAGVREDGQRQRAADSPVTIVVTRRVRAGREAAYEEWLRDLVQATSAMAGYLGAEIHRPSSTGSREYTTVFRFKTLDNLRAFQASDIRRRALSRVGAFVEADAVWKETTGLEFWFSAPPGTVVAQPIRWRMALVMIVVVFTLVQCIGRVMSQLLWFAPLPLRLLATITLEVMLMTYVLMPWITRKLALWIFPRARDEA